MPMYYLLVLIVVIFVAVFKMNNRKSQAVPILFEKTEEEPCQIASDCCGEHEICEFDESYYYQELIIYFDEEELDILRNVRKNELTIQQIGDLREVLFTPRTGEISKWLISIGRRLIHLPVNLQQKARQLIA